jgi:hypothetical protein
MLETNLDRFESRNGVVAGLVPATSNVKAQSQINGVAGTSPATTPCGTGSA